MKVGEYLFISTYGLSLCLFICSYGKGMNKEVEVIGLFIKELRTERIKKGYKSDEKKWDRPFYAAFRVDFGRKGHRRIEKWNVEELLEVRVGYE